MGRGVDEESSESWRVALRTAKTKSSLSFTLYESMRYLRFAE